MVVVVVVDNVCVFLVVVLTVKGMVSSKVILNWSQLNAMI